jgi:hypothetical protein
MVGIADFYGMDLPAALPCAPAALLALWLLGFSLFSSFAAFCRKLRLRAPPHVC